MASIDIIKSLREKTGLSVMACREALEASGGDPEKAILYLKEKGAAVADKKSSRAFGAGTVAAYVHFTKTIGAILELDCETDFVAKNEEFNALARDLAMHAAAMNPQSIEEMVNQPFVKDESKTIGDLIKNAVQKFGENTSIRRFERLSVKD